MIAKYQKAGDAVGLAELLAFYCERAAGFCENVDNQDVVYLDSLVRVFEHTLKAAANRTGSVQTDLFGRLDRVRSINSVNGVGDEMDVLLSEFESSTYPGGVQWKKK